MHQPVDPALHYRFMQRGEEAAVSELVVRVFNEMIASDYSAQGVEEFCKYAAPQALAERAQAHHFVLVAAMPDHLVGAIEVRHHDHICLLFVDPKYARQGIARSLLRRALATCRQRNPRLKQVTVNSSPYAVAVYERLGFRATAPEQEVNGIRFVPMVLELRTARPI